MFMIKRTHIFPFKREFQIHVPFQLHSSLRTSSFRCPVESWPSDTALSTEYTFRDIICAVERTMYHYCDEGVHVASCLEG